MPHWLFVRPGELRHAEWVEIDFDKKEWRIPGHKMKMKEQHIVPLSRQAIEIFRSHSAINREWEIYLPKYKKYRHTNVRKYRQLSAKAHGL
ncbi:tyrosine-type recombinase/integrase [Nitrosomonas communis]|uniref:tyrosine-type recombinase/integrase n=1 Tax=Nitrosomonas communis TaxID=44574 RepID=UPI003D2D04AA